MLAALEASDPYIAWRQLGIVERWGHTAVRTGNHNTAWAGHRTGDGWITMGNLLVHEGVVQARTMSQQRRMTWKSASCGHLTPAPGLAGSQRSAGILVYENAGYAVINLRVDDHDTRRKSSGGCSINSIRLSRTIRRGLISRVADGEWIGLEHTAPPYKAPLSCRLCVSPRQPIKTPVAGGHSRRACR